MAGGSASRPYLSQRRRWTFYETIKGKKLKSSAKAL
jgi:hypothetical protein